MHIIYLDSPSILITGVSFKFGNSFEACIAIEETAPAVDASAIPFAKKKDFRRTKWNTKHGLDENELYITRMTTQI